MTDIHFTSLQQKAYDYIVGRKNIFLTGAAGCGKSHVIHTFKNEYNNQKNIAITSTTGVSAIVIGGTTLFSYLSIGLGTGSVEDLVSKISKSNKAKKRWLDLEVLVIDEISMLSAELFDKLENVARIIRKKPTKMLKGQSNVELPFGGIQLVLSGDFLQLPVIGQDTKFCFEAESWNRCIDYTIELNENMRQSDDNIFQTMLSEIRYGQVSEQTKKILNTRIGINLTNNVGIKPTRIFTTNASVDYMNERELDKLSENNDFYEYDMDVYFYDFVPNKIQALEKYKKNCLAPECLQICVGAQVMLLSNLDVEAGLANGSRGVVVRFIEGMPVVKFLNGIEQIIDFYSWEIEEGKKKVVRITQIPLKLAWAITTHKSQSLTLDYVEVDLGNIFAYGQAYVALSRVKKLDSLSIIEINYDGIKTHPKALEYYKKLSYTHIS